MSDLIIVIDADLLAEVLIEDLGDDFEDKHLRRVARMLLGDIEPCLNTLVRHLIENQGLEDQARDLAELAERGV